MEAYMKYQAPYTPDFSARDANPGVNPLFPGRWSPRSFTGEPIPAGDLAVIFDAARWAPSAYNEQPWRILTSTPETFDTFLNLLVEPNQKWARNASLIGFIAARKKFTHNGGSNDWAVFDCGAAWMSIALQAHNLGLYAHCMAGIKKDEIYTAFGIPGEEFEVVAGFALGMLAPREKLEKPYVDWEVPSSRKALDEIWKQGAW